MLNQFKISPWILLYNICPALLDKNNSRVIATEDIWIIGSDTLLLFCRKINK